MRYCPTTFWYVSVLALLAIAPVLKAERLVVARSLASDGYLERRMIDGKRQPESYVFMAGRHFSGNTRDRTLERTSFRTIAERLAMDLRQQDFFPAESLNKANLLLVVHWGVTAGANRDSVALAMSTENLTNLHLESERAQVALDEAIAAGDMVGAATARGILDSANTETKAEQKNMLHAEARGDEDSARLLGFASELNKRTESLFHQERQKALFDLTREECYFVVVMAYDAPTLVNTKKLKNVWTLRVSISSAGVNFVEALDRMSNTASHHFGTKQDNVTFNYPMERERKGRVEMGDIIVLGAAEP